MILVTGATGTVGVHVVARLVRRGVPVRALVRDPARASALATLGAQLVRGDHSRSDTLPRALEGVTRLFLLTPTSMEHDAAEARLVDAGMAAGVRHAVKLSVLAADEPGAGAYARCHRSSERHLEQSGLAWTHLRPGPFMQNVFAVASWARRGLFWYPGDTGALPWTDARDVAEIAALALTEPGHEGRVHEITGPAALGHADVADRLAAIVHRRVRTFTIPRPLATVAVYSSGHSWAVARALNDLYAFYASARSYPTAAVATLTGAPPRSYEQFLSDHAAYLREPSGRALASRGAA